MKACLVSQMVFIDSSNIDTDEEIAYNLIRHYTMHEKKQRSGPQDTQVVLLQHSLTAVISYVHNEAYARLVPNARFGAQYRFLDT